MSRYRCDDLQLIVAIGHFLSMMGVCDGRMGCGSTFKI